jgi:carbamoyltransferase
VETVTARAPLTVGLSGSIQNASVTLCAPDRILGSCQQERITRVRGAGFNASGLPDEALDEVLRGIGHTRRDITTWAFAGTAPPGGVGVEAVRLDHHFAHACSTFLPSPFESAAVLVCDHESPAISVWEGRSTDLTRIDWKWEGEGLAGLYTLCAEVLGFGGAEQRMEALARLESDQQGEWAAPLFELDEDRLVISADWRERVASRCSGRTPREHAKVASALQARIGDLLVELLTQIRKHVPHLSRLCLGGSLFYNSFFNTRARLCGVFCEVFVPVDPGNAGLSIGAALHVGSVRQPVTPFLGPSFTADEIKATLENCKLTYRWVSETDAVTVAVDALRKGQLVAWFDGAMECGPRALGGRSILANPFAPYVLDNLNQFLKHRDPWRGYALSGLETTVDEEFHGPTVSRFMECDYVPKDHARFGRVLPGPRAAVRVQKVGEDAPPRFRALLRAFGEAAGSPVLVNTSFNGFREPIVCNPRDAVRVFFGTGIDVLVLGQFVLTK